MRIVLLFLLLLEFGFAKKVALVIGNSHYAKGYLANPINDAKLIRDTLKNDLGFEVTYEKDLNKYEMEKLIGEFSSSIASNDIALFYYSGHGMQYRNMNYLIPLKANAVTEGQVPSVSVDVNYILGGMENAKLAILLLDACRNNPFRSFTKSGDKGLAQISSHQRNYIVSYATEAGAVAKDGDGDNSPYALVLSELLKKPINVTNLFQEVRNRVAKVTGYVQYPYYDPHFIGSFKLSEGGGSCSKVVDIPPTYRRELVTIASERLVVIPTSYKTIKERILVIPEYRIYEWEENGKKQTLKPEFKKVFYKILDSESSTKIVLNSAKTVAKTITIPSKYKVATVKAIKKDVDLSKLPNVNVKSIYVPARYKTVEKRVVVKPASTRKVPIPAQYKRILVTPATQKTISVPCSEVK